MNTRLLAAGLWFAAAAYSGSILHAVVGLDTVIGPLIGLATGCLIVANRRVRLTTVGRSVGGARTGIRDPYSTPS
jgi:hypothetical protein